MRQGMLKTSVAAAIPVAALMVGLAGGGTAPAGPYADRPNIVVIQTDDQTVESMRVMERRTLSIGEQGATFPNHFVNWPVCCPSRATLQTGQYAHNHGVLGNEPPSGGYQAFDNTNTIAVWLQARGYVTAHVGKYLNGYGGPD